MIHTQLPVSFESLSPESVEGIVVVVFSIAAALISVFIERRKNKSENKTKINPAPVDSFLETAFEELHKTIDTLRDENRQLMAYTSKLGRVIDDYRDRYHEQVMISTKLLEEQENHKLRCKELNDKVDFLIEKIHVYVNQRCENCIYKTDILNDLKDLDLDSD